MKFLAKPMIMLLATAAAFAIANCGGSASPGVNIPTPTPVPSPSPVTAPTATTAVPLTLSISTTYDKTTYVNVLNFSETGTSSCIASVATPVVTCTVVVPEGRLYYSGLTFSFSYLATSCKLLTFTPYGYTASVLPGYLPPGQTSTVDCTPGGTTPPPLSCFGGAAAQMVPNYPNFNSLIYLPDETTLTTPNFETLKLASAYSLNYGSNRLTVNDLPAAKLATTFLPGTLGGGGDGYVKNTYSNYTFSCRDDWADPQTYIIHLNIRDEDSMTGTASPIDNVFTWKEAP